MRPPLPAADRRTRRKVVLFSASEWLVIEQRARECGLTPNRYIRDCAIGAVPRSAPGAANAPLVRQLARLGTSLRRANGTLPAELLADVRAILASI